MKYWKGVLVGGNPGQGFLWEHLQTPLGSFILGIFHFQRLLLWGHHFVEFC